jgi:hypothetical protein
MALVINSKFNIAHASPVSAIDLANRFSPFGSKYLASYSSTLAAPYDPFADVSQKPRLTGPAYNKPSAYMILPFSRHLFSIELEHSKVNSASELALSYFPTGFHWIPEHPLKSLAFILIFCPKQNLLLSSQSIASLLSPEK